MPYETPCKTGRISAKVRATKSRRTLRNERTQPTPLDPKLIFWCVSYYLCAFGTVLLPYETRCKTGRCSVKFVPRSCAGIFRNERIRSTPLDPKLTFWCVLFYMGAFGTVWLPYENRCKTGRTSAKVRATKSRRNFLHERTQSIPLDPKLLFWCVAYYLGAFGTFGCLARLGAKRAELVQKFVPRSRVGIFRKEHTRSTPWDPETEVLVRFVLSGCIQDRLVALQNSVQNGTN